MADSSMKLPKPSTFILSLLAGILALAGGDRLLPALATNHIPESSGSLSEGPSIPSISTVRSSQPLRLAQQSNFSSFFEDGRMLSDNQLRRQPPDPTLPVDTNSQYWQPIIFKAGGCSFWMPPGSLTEETVVLPTQVGAVSFRTLAAHAQNARYLTAYAAELSSSQLQNPQVLLQAIVNRVVPANKFTLLQNRPITLGGGRGRELSFQSDTEIIIFRAYLKGNRAYVIGARAPKAEGTPSRKTTNFLNSFQFLNP